MKNHTSVADDHVAERRSRVPKAVTQFKQSVAAMGYNEQVDAIKPPLPLQFHPDASLHDPVERDHGPNQTTVDEVDEILGQITSAWAEAEPSLSAAVQSAPQAFISAMIDVRDLWSQWMHNEGMLRLEILTRSDLAYDAIANLAEQAMPTEVIDFGVAMAIAIAEKDTAGAHATEAMSTLEGLRAMVGVAEADGIEVLMTQFQSWVAELNITLEELRGIAEGSAMDTVRAWRESGSIDAPELLTRVQGLSDEFNSAHATLTGAINGVESAAVGMIERANRQVLELIEEWVRQQTSTAPAGPAGPLPNVTLDGYIQIVFDTSLEYGDGDEPSGIASTRLDGAYLQAAFPDIQIEMLREVMDPLDVWALRIPKTVKVFQPPDVGPTVMVQMDVDNNVTDIHDPHALWDTGPWASFEIPPGAFGRGL